LLVSLGHGATHWVAATFYILLPAIGSAFELNYSEIGLLVTAFHASAVAANFGSGALVDLAGRRVVFQVLALVVGGLALAGFAVVGSAVALALLVAVIGATNNLWHPAAISYLSARLPARRGYALSMHALGANLGDAVAPLAAGALLVALSWRGTAAVNALPAFAAALALAATLLPVERGAGSAGRRGLSGREYLAGLAAMARDRAMLGLCLMSGFRAMTQTGLLTFLPLYVAHVVGLGPLWVGLTLSVMQVGGLIAGPLAGAWSDRVGRRPVVLAGLALTTAMLLGLSLVGSGALFVAGVAVLGFALYAVRPVVHSWAMDLTPPALGGSATSMLFGVQAILAALAPLIGGMIADRWGLDAVFYFLALTVFIANVMVFALPRDRPHAG